MFPATAARQVRASTFQSEADAIRGSGDEHILPCLFVEIGSMTCSLNSAVFRESLLDPLACWLLGSVRQG